MPTDAQVAIPLGGATRRLSRIGLGLAALGRPGYINLGHAGDLARRYDEKAMETHAHAVLDAAWAGGVRYVDAARSYGRAEAFLASWLAARNVRPADVVVGSKWGYVYTAGWQVDAATHEVKQHSLENLQRQWRESRSNLGDYQALYQIHSATLESGVLDDAGVLGELARIAASGVIVGLSVSGPGQAETVRKALTIRADGVALFRSVQATWNLLEPSCGPALAEAHAQGLLVIVKEALANGRLTSRNDAPEFASQAALLAREAERLHTSLDALALAAALAQPWAGVVLSGAATVEHVRSNLHALDVAWDGQAAATLSGLAEPAVEYWKRRSRLPWN